MPYRNPHLAAAIAAAKAGAADSLVGLRATRAVTAGLAGQVRRRADAANSPEMAAAWREFAADCDADVALIDETLAEIEAATSPSEAVATGNGADPNCPDCHGSGDVADGSEGGRTCDCVTYDHNGAEVGEAPF